MTSTEVFRTGQSWIRKTSDVCGGDACIRDTRIPVWSMIAARRLGIEDAELCNHFVTPLSAADVQAAFSYFELHSDEIEQQIKLNQDA